MIIPKMSQMIELTIQNLCWINGETDDPEDHCAHGRVIFRVGETTFVEPEDGDWTVNATGLYLLRTLSFDHTIENSVAEGNFLFPCCAFNVWPIKEKFKVLCMGCPQGIDVEVRHIVGKVHLEAENKVEQVTEAEWREAVMAFVRQIENFYASCTPKVAIDDEFDRMGWQAFWQEWRGRIA